MKLKLANFIAVLAACAWFLSMGYGPANAAPITIFHADFENSPLAIVPSDSLTPPVASNANIANLNAGTPIGAWLGTGATGGVASRGHIVGNATDPNDVTNKAFVLDHERHGDANRWAAGVFSQAVDIGAGESLTFTFDILSTRQSASNDRLIYIDLQTASGDTAYRLFLRSGFTSGGVSADRRVSYVKNGGPSGAGISDQLGVGSAAITVGGYRNWTWAGGNPHRIKIEVLGQTTVANADGALVSIDWNGDGTYDVIDAAIQPFQAGIGSIARFELSYGGTSLRGAYFDNMHVEYTPIPEPSGAVLLLAGAALAGAMRGKQRRLGFSPTGSGRDVNSKRGC